jgi:hypothetical protein
MAEQGKRYREDNCVGDDANFTQDARRKNDDSSSIDNNPLADLDPRKSGSNKKCIDIARSTKANTW